MRIINTNIEGCLVIQPNIHKDSREFFLETYQEKKYSEIIGAEHKFVQDNHSLSSLGVLRGLHFQENYPQGKLVRCTRGKVYDVAVDLRPQSKTFKKWVGIELNEDNFSQLWIPPGLAHGFLVLSENAEIQYKCTNYYYPEYEKSLLWNDPNIGIKWPLTDPILSDKDKNAILFSDLF